MTRTQADEIDFPTTDVLSWAFGTGSGATDLPEANSIWRDCHSDAAIGYDQVQGYIREVIAGLRAHNVQEGDAVCLHGFNSIWHIPLYLGTIGAGACFAWSNPAYRKEELERLYRAIKPKILLVEAAEVEKVIPAALASGINQRQILIVDEWIPMMGTTSSDESLVTSKQPFQSWRNLFVHGELDWQRFHTPATAKSTQAVYLSSSGTTGLPKIFTMSHTALLGPATMADLTVSHEPVRRLIALPMFHAYTLPFHLLALRRRQPTYIMRRFDAAHYIRSIGVYSITTTPVVPTMLAALCDTIAKSSSTLEPDLSSLREVICAGAPLNEETRRRYQSVLPRATRIVQNYGISETGWLAVSDGTESDETVGQSLPGVSVALIVDGKPSFVEGVVGELLVKSPGLMTGYLNNQEATTTAFTADGWFRTGDVGYCLNGKWYISDRVKDMMKVRGWQVSPAEIETCLLERTEVADAAVIGIPTTTTQGELPCAFVVLHYPLTNTDEVAEFGLQLKDHVAAKLASYKALTGGVHFVQDIPRGPSGKLLRKVLRDKITASSNVGKRIIQHAQPRPVP